MVLSHLKNQKVPMGHVTLIEHRRYVQYLHTKIKKGAPLPKVSFIKVKLFTTKTDNETLRGHNYRFKSSLEKRLLQKMCCSKCVQKY